MILTIEKVLTKTSHFCKDSFFQLPQKVFILQVGKYINNEISFRYNHLFIEAFVKCNVEQYQEILMLSPSLLIIV